MQLEMIYDADTNELRLPADSPEIVRPYFVDMVPSLPNTSMQLPFSRMMREGGSPKVGSWAAAERALDKEMLDAMRNN